MSAIAIVVIYGGLIWIEVPKMLRKNEKKELVVFSILCAVGLYYIGGKILDYSSPQITAGIDQIFMPVSVWFLKLMS